MTEAAALDAYERGTRSWVAGLTPPDALRLPVGEVIGILRSRFGADADSVLSDAEDRKVTRLAGTTARPRGWIRRTRMVGINVRTVGSFWRVIHYSLTLPAEYDAIHLLPIWEPGVVGSLYGMASWELNEEFTDAELKGALPRLRGAGEQLAATISLLHLQGRAVGLDMIPHTDRFSEIVLAEPQLFEWLRREGESIVDHRANLHEEVMDEIDRFVAERGAADEATDTEAYGSVFSPRLTERERSRIIFGAPDDREGRAGRREELITRLNALGYEPVPATMGPPYRGIEVDPASLKRDSGGRSWCEYRISHPKPMSRVFGPLTRYKFYQRTNDNEQWEIDFSRPRTEVFDYLRRNVDALVREYSFDFVRGDMSHVQMRPNGVPVEADDHYDPFRYVCARVGEEGLPYFAESFLAPPGTMAFGDEVDHLEAAGAAVTLGDLQSVPIGGPEFLPRLRRYLDIAASRLVTPSFTVMTADKDDPRFDRFYRDGNELRTFLSLFLPLPSYVGLGFEMRDPHPEPARNEFYTKLFVFHETSGPKATRGPYRFGANTALFAELTRIREFAERLHGADLVASIRVRMHSEFSWLLTPDACGGSPLIAWRVAYPGSNDVLFLANTSTQAAVRNTRVPTGDQPGTTARQPRSPLFVTPAMELRPVEAREGYLYVRELPPAHCLALSAGTR